MKRRRTSLCSYRLRADLAYSLAVEDQSNRPSRFEVS